ncbi:MAG: nuclear transport factor 2 family protein [Oscillospiraceae bacterium]|nr:nuclear transport factor 2 family protein [Oscillospiraceae bacterium]
MTRLTEYEQAIRLWDMEEVKDLLARRAYYISGDRRRELDDLWVQDYYHRKTASYGSNWGFYVGFDQISEFFSVEKDAYAPGTGDACHHTLSTGHVQVAADGNTARALFYDISLDARAQGDSYVNLGPVAVDCVKENGQWKIWHLFCGYDHCLPLCGDYSAVPVVRNEAEHPYRAQFGSPTISMKTYDPDFGWSQEFVTPPMPYQTFNALRSYGPEGHPRYQEVAV